MTKEKIKTIIDVIIQIQDPNRNHPINYFEINNLNSISH